MQFRTPTKDLELQPVHSYKESNSMNPLEMRLIDFESAGLSDTKINYDPYKIPADLNMARNHAIAKRVGKPNFNNVLNICPCCNMHIENELFPMCCNLQDLSFLGCAYPFLFFYIKQVLFILCAFFFIGGSFNLLIVNWNCTDNCVRFFGFGILNMANLNSQVTGLSWLSTLVSIVMLVFMFCIKPKFFEAMKHYNDTVVSISSYTIMVQNLPKDITKEEIVEYFYNLTKQKIIKVNFAYNVEKYQENFNRKLRNCSRITENQEKLVIYKGMEANKDNHQDINKGLIDLDIEDTICQLQQETEDLLQENIELEEKLQEFERNCEESQSSEFTGTAFVTFNSQLPVKVLIDQWGVTYLKNIQFLLFGRCSNPYLRFRKKTIQIHTAPDPTDLIWENLDFSFVRDFFNYILLYFVSGMILVLSFYIQFLVVTFVFKLRKETEITIAKAYATNSFLVKMTAISISSLVTMINAILRIIVYYFSYYQKMYSTTKLNQSYINVYIFLVFFNSAFMPYLINTFCYDNSTNEQLIWDIHLILLTNAFSTPVYKLCDPWAWHRRLMRLYIRFKGKSCVLTQHEVNRWFEGQYFDIAENYAYVTRTLFLCTWYASVAPLGLIFGMVGLVFNYWLDKFFLLRVTAFPVNQSEDIIKKIINNLEFIPYLYIFGTIEYHQKIIISYNLLEFIWAFMFYGLTSATMTALLLIYIIFYKPKIMSKNLSELKYEDARFMFFTEYDRVNPLTENQGNKEWIEYIKENTKLSENHKKNLIKKANQNVRENRNKVVSFIAGGRASFNRKMLSEEKVVVEEELTEEQIQNQRRELEEMTKSMKENKEKLGEFHE